MNNYSDIICCSESGLKKIGLRVAVESIICYAKLQKKTKQKKNAIKKKNEFLSQMYLLIKIKICRIILSKTGPQASVFSAACVVRLHLVEDVYV